MEKVCKDWKVWGRRENVCVYKERQRQKARERKKRERERGKKTPSLTLEKIEESAIKSKLTLKPT